MTTTQTMQSDDCENRRAAMERNGATGEVGLRCVEGGAATFAVPPGFRLVPIEPTPEMVGAMAIIEASSTQVTTYDDGSKESISLIGMSGAVEAYEAMLDASSPYPKGEVVGPCVCGSWPGDECLRCTQLVSSASNSTEKSDGWLPIESAPSNELVVVGWLDAEDEANPERHDFDYLEDGVWQKLSENVEYFQMCAPAGSRGPREQAPYTHFMLIDPIPTAPTQGGQHGE